MRGAAKCRTLHAAVVAASAWLVAAGCATSQSEDAEEDAAAVPSATETSAPPLEQDDLVTLTVTYGGQSCLYDGPTELSPGPVVIEFVNDSKVTAFLDVARLADDVTWEDFAAFHSPEPKEGARPDQLATFDSEQAEAFAGHRDSITSVMHNGEYALVCLRQGKFNALARVARPGGVTVSE